MAKQTISLGTAPAGAGGDDRRSAWLKAIANFNELYDWLTGAAGGTTLPAALPLAKGGTGATTAAAARTALQLGDAATRVVVGPVSQSGGVSTGAIIERGSNANGSYTKFADGTLICRRTIVYSGINISTAIGALYYSPAGLSALTFPQAFVAVPDVTWKANFSGGIGWLSPAGSDSATAVGATYPLCALARTSETITATYIAVGRWYQ